MTWLASIQQVADSGAIQPLPDQHDVTQIVADTPDDLMPKVADVLWEFRFLVRDFDLTITNQALPLPGDDEPSPRHRIDPNADESRARGITAL